MKRIEVLQILKIPSVAHAQTFAAALPHHAGVLTSLTNTQTSIQETKTALLEMKESLGNRRADLAQLWTRGQTLDEMIKIVDEMFVARCLIITLNPDIYFLIASISRPFQKLWNH